MPGRHVFSGKLDKAENDFLLHADDGQEFILRHVEGIDGMVGSHVLVLGVLYENQAINAFRVQRDAVILPTNEVQDH